MSQDQKQEQELHAGEWHAGAWVADGVLAALGLDLGDEEDDVEMTQIGGKQNQEQEQVPNRQDAEVESDVAISRRPATAASPNDAPPRVSADARVRTDMALIPFRSTTTQGARLPHRQMVKTELASPQPVSTLTRVAPHRRDRLHGLRDTAPSSVGSQAGVQEPPMALKKRPTPPGFDHKRVESAAPMSRYPGDVVNRAERPLLQDGPEFPAKGVLAGRIRRLGAPSDSRDAAPVAMPSRPRFMLPNRPLRAEFSRPAPRTEPRGAAAVLAPHDLAKGPCHRCHFVHKGGDCETSCIGCGSRRADRHDLSCPFKDKMRRDNDLQVPVKKDPVSFKEPTSRIKAEDPQVSLTMQLSLECQKLGFNPEFKYYRSGEFDNRADLFIKGVCISGKDHSYKSQKDARDALAPKGLELVRQMKQGSFTEALHTTQTGMGGLSIRQAPPTGLRSYGRPPSPARPVFRSQSSSYRQPERLIAVRDDDDPVMDLIKSAQPPVDWRERRASTIDSSIRMDSQRLGNRQQDAPKDSIVVKLPENIRSNAAQTTLERAIAANPQSNISLHFPANVSVEVAQAYGMAMGAIAASNRRRSRSRSPPMREMSNRRRSRSPLREVPRDFRDRTYDQERDRYRERDSQDSRSSLWPPRPPRPYADAYRPLSRDVPQRRNEDSRLRLSPPAEWQHRPPHDRRDRYSRDECDRR